jgi:hypothetical protein
VKREKYVTVAAKNITHNIQRVVEPLEKSDQLWTQLLEDGSLQELQGKEDKLHEAMADVK